MNSLRCVTEIHFTGMCIVLSFVSLSIFCASECRSLLCFLVQPFTPHTRSDLQSLIRWEIRQQKHSFSFFKVSNNLLTACSLNLLHIQILCSPSLNRHCLSEGDVDLPWLVICSECWSLHLFCRSRRFFLKLCFELHHHFIMHRSNFIEPVTKLAKHCTITAFAICKEKPFCFQLRR